MYKIPGYMRLHGHARLSIGARGTDCGISWYVTARGLMSECVGVHVSEDREAASLREVSNVVVPPCATATVFLEAP